MNVTREWLEKNSPCADGGSWGAFEVGPNGLDLRDCWEKFSRADWLVWMLWKTEAYTFEATRDLAYSVVSKRLRDKSAQAIAVFLPSPGAPNPERARALEAQAFGEAHAANMLGYEVQARELMAAGYLARAFRALPEQAIHAAQAAIVQLVASKPGAYPMEIHRDICREIFSETGLTYLNGVRK